MKLHANARTCPHSRRLDVKRVARERAHGLEVERRYREEGEQGLLDRCSAPASAPLRTGEVRVELISPAGFEAYFRELAPLLAAQKRDEAALADVVARYELEIDFDTIPLLAERHCLWLG